jgi:release factor glutamine methyltransferase
MGEPRLSLTLHGEHVVQPGAAMQMERLAQRRRDGEPVARILGQQEFWGLDFSLSPGTLVPRPDSETIVEAALGWLGARGGEAITMLDLGTGSGCLLVALLHECRAATGYGVDISLDALVTARHNAQRAGVGSRAHWLASRWNAALDVRADLVVSNPPYIMAGEIGSLSREVRLHDPMAALDGGGDGLDAYRALAVALPSLLKPGGSAVLETGAGQSASVTSLMARAGLILSASRNDLGGHVRALVFTAGEIP